MTCFFHLLVSPLFVSLANAMAIVFISIGIHCVKNNELLQCHFVMVDEGVDGYSELGF